MLIGVPSGLLGFDALEDVVVGLEAGTRAGPPWFLREALSASRRPCGPACVRSLVLKVACAFLFTVLRLVTCPPRWCVRSVALSVCGAAVTTCCRRKPAPGSSHGGESRFWSWLLPQGKEVTVTAGSSLGTAWACGVCSRDIAKRRRVAGGSG